MFSHRKYTMLYIAAGVKVIDWLTVKAFKLANFLIVLFENHFTIKTCC